MALIWLYYINTHDLLRNNIQYGPLWLSEGVTKAHK